MIVLDDDEEQLPKLQTPALLPTARAPEVHFRPRHPILPDYETSQAQQRLLTTLRTKGQRSSRICRATVYAFTLYIALFFVVGVPLFLTKLRDYAPWHRNPPPFPEPPPGPPPPFVGASVDLTLPLFAGEALQCNNWEESPGNSQSSSSSASSASLQFSLPIDSPILIRVNSTSPEADLRGISGRLHVDLNPDANARDALIEVTADYLGQQYFSETFVCMMKSENNTGVGLYVPRNLSETDRISFNMTLLLPQPTESDSLRLQKISTYLPYFDQSFGPLSPQLTFERVSIEGLQSQVTFDSVEASSLSVRTSEAEISGSFNISETISLDTINGVISANVSLMHDRRAEQPTFLAFDTGNGAIQSTLNFFAFGEHVWHPRHTHHRGEDHDFVAEARTFNAPIDIAITHSIHSQPARFYLQAQNTQAAVNVSLDPLFSGTFDLQAKSATPIVQEREVESVSGWGKTERRLLYDHEAYGRLMGWTGYGDRPEREDWKRESHIGIISSLSPVVLQLDRAS